MDAKERIVVHDGLMGIYQGAGLVPADIEARLDELVGQLDACGLPDDVRDDIEAVVAEIEQGRGRSREVSSRLARIRRDNVGSCAEAAAGLATALGLDG
jgi:hypothetical protein